MADEVIAKPFARRTVLQALSALSATALSGSRGSTQAAETSNRTTTSPTLKRISTEEGFTTQEVLDASRKLGPPPGGGLMSQGVIGGPLLAPLLDLGAGRIAGMDADRVDLQLLLLSAPGVQNFDAPTGVAIARSVNDRLADAIRANPTRLQGLAAIAPQDPTAAADELARAVKTLKLKGAVINSHTHGEYLDDPKFWPIFEAAESLDVPIYIHPRDPAPQMAGPLAIPGFAVSWGFNVETGTHALRLIGSGVFDRFPKLRIVLGHMGETIPFLLHRIDNRFFWEQQVFHRAALKRAPSEYFLDNFVITTSGMNYKAPLMASLAEMGTDKVLFAADYPFEVQKDAVASMDAMGLAPDLLKKVFQTNAERVFKL